MKNLNRLHKIIELARHLHAKGHGNVKACLVHAENIIIRSERC